MSLHQRQTNQRELISCVFLSTNAERPVVCWAAQCTCSTLGVDDNILINWPRNHEFPPGWDNEPCSCKQMRVIVAVTYNKSLRMKTCTARTGQKYFTLSRQQQPADSEQLYIVQSPKGPFEVTAILAQVYNSMTQSFTCWLIQTSVIEWSPLNGLNLYNRERETRGGQLFGLGDEHTGLGVARQSNGCLCERLDDRTVDRRGTEDEHSCWILAVFVSLSMQGTSYRPSKVPPQICQWTDAGVWRRCRSAGPCSSSATRPPCSPPVNLPQCQFLHEDKARLQQWKEVFWTPWSFAQTGIFSFNICHIISVFVQLLCSELDGTVHVLRGELCITATSRGYISM